MKNLFFLLIFVSVASFGQSKKTQHKNEPKKSVSQDTTLVYKVPAMVAKELDQFEKDKMLIRTNELKAMLYTLVGKDSTIILRLKEYPVYQNGKIYYKVMKWQDHK